MRQLKLVQKIGGLCMALVLPLSLLAQPCHFEIDKTDESGTRIVQTGTRPLGEANHQRLSAWWSKKGDALELVVIHKLESLDEVDLPRIKAEQLLILKPTAGELIKLPCATNGRASYNERKSNKGGGDGLSVHRYQMECHYTLSTEQLSTLSTSTIARMRLKYRQNGEDAFVDLTLNTRAQQGFRSNARCLKDAIQ